MDSLLSHKDIHIIGMVLVLHHLEGQDFLVKKEATETFLTCLALFFKLSFSQSLLLKFPLFGAFLK